MTKKYKKSTILHGTVEKSQNKSTHYVVREDFYNALVERKKQIADGLNPQVSNYIGECLLKISNGLAAKWNFRDYTYKEEMVSDGVIHCLRYIDKFDPLKSTNPFSYFTQAMYFMFVNRIRAEKTEQYVKYKATISSAAFNEVATQPEWSADYDVDMSDLDFSEIEAFVHDYEQKEKSASKSKKPKKPNKLNLDNVAVDKDEYDDIIEVITNGELMQPNLDQDYLRGNDQDANLNENLDDQQVLTEVLPKDNQDQLNG